MRVVRGRHPSLAADRAATATLADTAAETGEAVVRAWVPHRHVAFGRRDARSEGYDRARAAAGRLGYQSIERSVGGRAVVYTGRTIAFARAEPTDSLRTDIDERYGAAREAVEAALESLGADLREGEPPDAFCPGSHSLQGDGKVAGLAQRVRQDAAVVAGVVVVADPAAVATVLDPVYAALGVPFDPDSVGSVAGSGGPSDPVAAARAVERGLVGDRDATVVHVRDT
jgi:lipoate-protein ligase A